MIFQRRRYRRTQSQRRHMVKVAIVATIAYALFSGHAGAQANPPYSPDPRIASTIRIVSAMYPAPPGCAITGGWEDGTIVAYCPDAALGEHWLAHGPESTDMWGVYTGPLFPQWVAKANAYDGDVQYSTVDTCGPCRNDDTP